MIGDTHLHIHLKYNQDTTDHPAYPQCSAGRSEIPLLTAGCTGGSRLARVTQQLSADSVFTNIRLFTFVLLLCCWAARLWQHHSLELGTKLREVRLLALSHLRIY